jgi:glycosyltransferase involved in cell wall biosynthesis
MLPIGVLIPTLDSAAALPGHLESMSEWLDLVEEVVVVDSFSQDGTLELMQSRLRHPRLKILSHPRGLYQSWNHGIRNLTARYCYISTVGDSITRAGLEHLHNAARKLDSDVVVSKPQFITNGGVPMMDVKWPIHDMLSTLQITEPVRLETWAVLMFALRNIPSAVLGSSASNLYGTNLLQRFPFPTDFGTVGDGAWSISTLFEYKFVLTPETFSTFRHHPKAYRPDEYAVADISRKLFQLACETLRNRLASDPVMRADARCGDYRRLIKLIQSTGEYIKWQQELVAVRDCKLPWIFKPRAWWVRAQRNRQRRLMSEQQLVIKSVWAA